MIIRPSLKGGLCMSAGQKISDDDDDVGSKFEIRDVRLIQSSLRMGNQSNDGL